MFKIKYISSLLLLSFLGCESTKVSNTSIPTPATNPQSAGQITTSATNQTDYTIYQFKVLGLEGDTIDFAKFKGKKILIVNTASKCKYTPQYEYLEKLYATYGDKLVIIGFPCNDFGGQEPGTAVDIREFCTKNYGVTFLMASKVTIKGKDMAPIYRWLTSKEENGVMDADITWNFHKFLIDENGKLIAKFGSKTSPYDDEIVAYLK